MGESNWRELYKAAVLEVDRNKLRDRVRAAEEAIFERAKLNGQISPEERIAIDDAMSALHVIKRECEPYKAHTSSKSATT